MNPSAPSAGAPPDANPEAWNSALFAQLVLQQSNMAMMLLGKTPHPESGQTIRDLDAARLFIDQLEMLQAKTRGNLSKSEESLLNQNLMSLRLAFVEAVESPAEPPPAESTKPAGAAGSAPAATGSPGQDAGTSEEPHKRFTKKY